jgi:hypothetical protein
MIQHSCSSSIGLSVEFIVPYLEFGTLVAVYFSDRNARSYGSLQEKISMAIKREVIEPEPGDKRYARRDQDGHFTEHQVSVGKSLAADRRTHANKVVPTGQGDQGDQKKRG